MLVIELTGEDLKNLMNLLLKHATFDKFQVRGVEICTYTKFSISGILEKTYYPEAEREGIKRNYCLWSELRGHALEWIKGDRQPKALKIVFSPDEEATADIHGNAAALFLNLHYEDQLARFTTATSQKSFDLDKSLDQAWDEMIRKFFRKNFPKVNTG